MYKKVFAYEPSPFVERNLQCEQLPFHFLQIIEQEMKEQDRKRKFWDRKKSYQIDFNKMYGWTAQISRFSYQILRQVVMNKNSVNLVLENDIQKGYVKNLLRLAQSEYRYQLKQQKLGKRKHICVDFNVLYC
jgi:hypothetical protein